MIEVEMEVSVSEVEFDMDIESDTEELDMDIATEYAIARVDEYDGSYEFTPTEETQTIEIEDKRATENIIINPIPSNYGLITWDGATLTVS